MSQYCIACHTEISVDGGACPSCDITKKMPHAGVMPPIDDDQDVPAPHSNSGRIWIGLSAVLLLSLMAAYYFIFIRDDMAQPGGKPVAVAASSAIQNKTVTLFTITKANIRDAATTSGSNIVGTLARGSPVQGHIVAGNNSEDTWLQLTDERGFVSSVNLNEAAPPPFLKLLSDKVWKTDGPTDIYSAPRGGELLDRVDKDTALTLAGLVSGDSIEIKLRSGGVGYIMDGARIVALLETPAPPQITMAFRPNTCDFGGGVEALFKGLSAQELTRRKAIENRSYPDPDARQSALEAYDQKNEQRSIYAKTKRTYGGLTITGIGQHYESQSVYFDDPPAKVIAAFKAAGYKIDGEGQFQTSELYSGIGAADGQERSYGNTSLSCGV